MLRKFLTFVGEKSLVVSVVLYSYPGPLRVGPAASCCLMVYFSNMAHLFYTFVKILYNGRLI